MHGDILKRNSCILHTRIVLQPQRGGNISKTETFIESTKLVFKMDVDVSKDKKCFLTVKP